jgi:hypothetical protein
MEDSRNHSLQQTAVALRDSELRGTRIPAAAAELCVRVRHEGVAETVLLFERR